MNDRLKPFSWSMREVCWRLRRGNKGENLAGVGEIGVGRWRAWSLLPGRRWQAAPFSTAAEAKEAAEEWARSIGR